MYKKIFLILIICGFLISPTFSIAAQQNNNYNIKKILQKTNKSNSYETDTPTWEEGDTWTYDMTIEGELGDALAFNWGFRDLLFTVESDQGSTYIVTINGEVTGEINIFEIQIISGSLKDTTITGEIVVDKSNIGFKNINAHIEGKIAVVGIPLKPFTMDINVDITPSFNAIDFPLKPGKQWTTPACNVTGTAEVSLLENPIYIDDLIGGNTAECTGVETVTIDAGTYEAFVILSDGDVSTLYYAEDAGNVIRAYGDEEKSIDITMESTTYGVVPGAPNRPSKPQGPTRGTPKKTYTYSSSTTDNEGDDIYYLFDWGDGTHSSWIGPYHSGETVKASHKWSKKNTYRVRVKAKDVEGHESKWSSSLTVSMPRDKNRILSSSYSRLWCFFQLFFLQTFV